ncbi:MarR family transcriptional regulator [Azospirillum sp. SYSU D00513]|uniref:MarR family winged helix-turn-helix transcriptional regulator n=1 Tax=Azospirillum sp. SYSU D00513 TaxID=2812561 RepID=UPI001A96620C|nr:MarR family transcriptional regulator [Azospirillum sp. SYSU D00513]
MTHDAPNLDEFLCFAIHSTARAINRAAKPLLDELGLTYPQYLVMVVLWAEDDQTVGQIGEKLFLESSTLTPLLKRLEQAGYVRRARDAADERLVRVRLTETGRALGHRSDCTSKLLRKVLQGNEVRELRDRVVSLRERVRAAERDDALPTD